MKRTFFGILLLFAIATKVEAQEAIKYWYYPAQNVYFNEESGNYWFYDESRVEWVEASRLPAWLTMTDNDARYEISYKGPKVWKDNKKHKEKYKLKKDGTVKEKNE